MLSFILGLLKVIGIILLILFLTIVVVVALVLFVPIRYQGRGEINTEKKTAWLKATWLLKMVCVQLDYTFPEKPVIGIKVLGMDIMKLLNKPPKKKLTKGESDSVVEVKTAVIETTQEIIQEQATQDDLDNTSTEEQIDIVQEDLQEDVAEEKLTLHDKIEKILFKIKSIYDKIKSILYNIQYYIEVFQEEDTQALLINAKDSILKILKSVRPREFLLTGIFGFDTPDTTGKVYGYYCMAMPWIGEYVQLEPDFENKRLEGEVNLKGRITVFVILVNGLRILFDKRLKPLLKKLKHGGKQNGR